MINNKVARQLESIDWDFSVQQPGTTKIAHWYPGTFPAQLPTAFIQALTRQGDIVFDPYGGCGTTASESIRLGRKSWVVDLNPVGILANYPYCALILLKSHSEKKFNLFLAHLKSLLFPKYNSFTGLNLTFFNDDLLDIDSFVSKHMRPKPEYLSSLIRHNDKPNWDGLKKWIHPSTLNELKDFHFNTLKTNPSSFFRIFVDFMISANIRAICSQNKSWGHIADNVYPKEFIYKDVISQLRGWYKRLETNLSKVEIMTNNKPKGIQYWAEVYNWSSHKPFKSKPRLSPSVIITSPPYGNAIDYIYSQKMSLYFLGYTDIDIIKLHNNEFGARRKRSKNNSIETWAEKLKSSVKTQVSYLKKGYIVTILPHKNHGRELGINYITEELYNSNWKKIFEADRSIDQKKTRQSWTSIKQETICIFTKE